MRTFLLGTLLGVGLILAVDALRPSPRPRIDTLTLRIAQVDTVRVRDSVRVVRTVHALDTIRQTVLDHITDTVIVKEYIARTDTLRAACLACVASASLYKQVSDSLNTENARLIRQLDRRAKWQKYLPLASGIVGFTLGAKLRP